MKLSTTLIFGMLSALSAGATAQTFFVPSGDGGVGASTTTNIGIGVSNPSPFDGGARKTLHLKNASNDALFRITGSLVDTELGVNSTGVGFWYTRTGHDLTLGTNNTERMRVGKEGNVGIGTTNPLDRLHVNGGIRTEGWGFLRGFNGTTELYRVMSQEAGEFRIASMETGRDIRFSTRDAGGTDRISLTIEAGQSAGSPGSIGIGTTAPDALLTVNGAVHVSAGDPLGQKLYLGTGIVTHFIGFEAGTTNYDKWEYNEGLRFVRYENDARVDTMFLTAAGNVGIGISSPTHKLTVNGTIRAKEVIVDTGWADYVFAEDYRLAPLSEVEAHIKEHKHLPDMPSAAEVAEQGVSMGEIQAKMMAKIEEMMLHMIAQEKRVQVLEGENKNLRMRVQELESQK